MARGKEREDGPSKNQLRGLTYNANKPKFLRDSITALSGGSGKPQSDGRPPIPTRPPGDRTGDANDDDDDDNKLDERDLGDEAPQIVVLKEGKDLTAEEVEEAQKETPLLPASASTGTAAKKGSSLRFASNDKKGSTITGSKRKIVGRSYDDDNDNDNNHIDEEATVGDGFNDLVKRAKVDTTNATSNKEALTSAVQNPLAGKEAISSSSTKDKEKKSLTKEEKAAMKAKRKAAKKLLSFED